MAGEVDVTNALIQTPVAAGDWLIILPVVLPIAGGALLLMLRKRTHLQAGLAIAILALLTLITGALLARVAELGPQVMMMGRWLPPFGIAFTADLAGALLAFTGSVVALVCGAYAVTDIDATRMRYGFYPFLMLMMAGVNGAFLTGDIFNLYVWFEVLLISSFGLIVLGSERQQLDGATKYAFLNLIATTLFLVATGLLYGALGTLNMADITLKLAAPVEPGAPQAPIFAIAVMYLFAFAMKAAAFPLNNWLPASYHTPRIVVGALFAGLLTKVGVYALLRVIGMLFAAERDMLSVWIAVIAMLTMLFGVLGALAQTDLRRLLGFLVVSGIGSMLAGLALAGNLGLSASLFYAVHSMLVMSALYIGAGIMAKRSGTWSLRELGGHYAASPWFAAAFLCLSFAVAGLPPFSGFWPKIMLVRASLSSGGEWLAASILLTGFLTSIAVGRVWVYAFWRGGAEGVRDGAENWKMQPVKRQDAMATYVPFGILVVIVLAIGLAPEHLLSLASDAARGLMDPSAYVGAVFPGGK